MGVGEEGEVREGLVNWGLSFFQGKCGSSRKGAGELGPEIEMLEVNFVG